MLVLYVTRHVKLCYPKEKHQTLVLSNVFEYIQLLEIPLFFIEYTDAKDLLTFLIAHIQQIPRLGPSNDPDEKQHSLNHLHTRYHDLQSLVKLLEEKGCEDFEDNSEELEDN